MPVTANIYQRVVRLVTPTGDLGTAFTVDHGDSQYLVTAEHLIADQPETVTMTLRGDSWERRFNLARLDGVTGGADIAVFRLDEPITQQLPVNPTLNAAVFTQDVYFLGFPYGLAFELAGTPFLPFVKKGILSAAARHPGRPGASSISTASTTQDSRVGPSRSTLAGPKEPHICPAWCPATGSTSSRVRVGGAEIDAEVLENTGIVIAYDIKHAMDAIEAT